MSRSNLCIYLSKQQPLPGQIPPASDLEKAAPRNFENLLQSSFNFLFFSSMPSMSFETQF